MATDVMANWQSGAGHFGGAKQPALLTRFTSKMVLDILPAALASLIGAALVAHFQLGRAAAPQPVAEQMSPASAEVLALVRDEHNAIVSFLKTQMAAEKSRLDAQDAETARAVAEAKVAQENKAAQEIIAAQTGDGRDNIVADAGPAGIKLASAAVRRGTSNGQAKVILPRVKPSSVAESPAQPLAIAQADANVQPGEPAAESDRLARDPNSLLAKTLDFKDHVVAATRQAVAAIGDVFSSVGDRISGGTPTPRPFSSDS